MPRMGVLLLSTIVVLSSCGGGTSTPKRPAALGGAQQAGGADTVVLHDLRFQPSATTVRPGKTVTWLWKDDGTPHNVVADDKSFTSGDPKTSGSFRHAFLRAGTFAYQCVVHPTMTGTITVR